MSRLAPSSGIILCKRRMAKPSSAAGYTCLLAHAYRVEDTPSSFDAARAIVLFPSDDAVDVQQLEAGSFDTVFIIDSRWSVTASRLGGCLHTVTTAAAQQRSNSMAVPTSC